MPIFEYECNSCSKVFEVIQLPGHPDNGLKCPACNGGSLRKLISVPFLPSSVGRPANDEGVKFNGNSALDESVPGSSNKEDT